VLYSKASKIYFAGVKKEADEA
jgi:hypothetical protein